jgi:hypothetical protein
MATIPLENNKTYSSIIFEWSFNTPSGLCPSVIEQQYNQYRKTIFDNYYSVTRSMFIPKNNNDSLIKTAIEFKNILRAFPMFQSQYISIGTFKLSSIKFEGDLTDLNSL